MDALPLGATLDVAGRCHWRVWSPRARSVDVALYDDQGRESFRQPLQLGTAGYYEGFTDNIAVGQRYAFRREEHVPRPDPASRWQPDGVHKPSAVWRAEDFTWTDAAWTGIARRNLVIYELHVGTFTPEGTFAAMIPRLAALRDLGVTAIELMPVAQFPGTRGWGYDGVYWYAVQHSYGGPTELQRLVDACHREGLAVILDVVYNHLGPEGNYLNEYGPYFTNRYHTPWGDALNYDGPFCDPVRDFVFGNVRQWVRDFHIDGLRLDAVSEIRDTRTPHLLTEIKQVADETAHAAGRMVHIIGESNLNDVKLLAAPELGGYGLDAQWSDDFHHSVHALLTGERNGYYVDFDQPARCLTKALATAFVFDGGYSHYRQRKHGAPTGSHLGDQFIISIQTHDQVGNRACGDRFGTLLAMSQQRLAAGLMLLSPYLPMLFMGEEYGETRPFPYFCDFGDRALGAAVRRGRRAEFAEFGWTGALPDPLSEETYASAILTWTWPTGSPQAGLRTLYQTLLQLRRTHPALQDWEHRTVGLSSAENQAHVLSLLRGDPARPEECVLTVFNLTAQPVTPLLSAGFPTHRLLFSEETRFTGTAENSFTDAELPPFAFAVYDNPHEMHS